MSWSSEKTDNIDLRSFSSYGFLFVNCYHVCQFKAAVCTKTVKTICIPVKPCPIFHHRGEGGPRPTYCQNLGKVIGHNILFVFFLNFLLIPSNTILTSLTDAISFLPQVNLQWSIDFPCTTSRI